jgi:hypothetical protein
MANESRTGLDERYELLERAWSAYRAINPPPRSEVFPRGVRKFHSIFDMKNYRDQRIIDWFLSREGEN